MRAFVKRQSRLIAFFAAVFPFMALSEEAPSQAREWISESKSQEAEWKQIGTLELPSGEIFIGDPSWSDGYHMRGARSAGAEQFEIWVFSDESGQNHALWLEAAGTAPARILSQLDFGTDSYYLGFGDAVAGRDLANLGKLDDPQYDSPRYYNSFEFFLPVIQADGFHFARELVPPHDRPAYVLNTNRDGGLAAVWVADNHGALSGILIDITGRAGDGLYIDKLLENG